MKDKYLVFAVIGCFIFTIGFASVIVWEVKKSEKKDEKMRQLNASSKRIAVDDIRDFSIYETMVGTDGREMVLIPEGVFTRGASDGDFDEKPEQEIYLDAFYVDKYEVSVKAYNKYRKAANYVKPSVPFFAGDSKVMDTPEFPVVGVSWHDSTLYCEWAGKRLLTEAEWEKAARGTHGLIYPWGNKFLRNRANVRGTGDGYEYMSPVGSYPMGRSVYGVYDMAGNVSEWVLDWYDQFYYQKSPMMNPPGHAKSDNHVFKGGSWDASKVDVRPAKRFAATPRRKDSIVGFRCGWSKEKAKS